MYTSALTRRIYQGWAYMTFGVTYFVRRINTYTAYYTRIDVFIRIRRNIAEYAVIRRNTPRIMAYICRAYFTLPVPFQNHKITKSQNHKISKQRKAKSENHKAPQYLP